MTESIILRTMRLQAFANNNCDTGHLKSWKANGIMLTLESIPDILKDEDRLRRYVDGCLKMEGFNNRDCDQIVKYLQELHA